MLSFLLKEYAGIFSVVFYYLFKYISVWLPLLTGYAFIDQWLSYKRRKFILEQGSVLLEIKIPKEITKSPLAMELILTALWPKGSIDMHETFLNGKVRPWYSLEIASIDGYVRFYIWTTKKLKDYVEAQFYAHYPNIEMVEVEDYSKKIPFNLEKYVYWATHYKLSLSDVYPIKTYVDFGLDDASVKEEYKTDPIASLLEFLGSIKKGEQAWIQILIQSHRKEGLADGLFGGREDWKKKGENEIKKIREEITANGKDGKGFPNPTKMQTEAMTAIERSLSKYPYDVCIRSMYIAEKAADQNKIRTVGLSGAFLPFSSNYKYFNEIKKGIGNGYLLPWQDFQDRRSNKNKKLFLDAYKRRSFFQGKYKNWKATRFILTTEELATIFHLPGEVVATPTLMRIPSRKSNAPSNLPV